MGRFADKDDVKAQFEGVIASSRDAWVTAKIDLVESVLTGLVPSLASVTESTDPVRFARARLLVAAKTLEIYRNPAGATADAAVGQSVTWNAAISTGRVSFTKQELATVRQRTRRLNLGTAKVAPWRADRAPGVFRGW